MGQVEPRTPSPSDPAGAGHAAEAAATPAHDADGTPLYPVLLDFVQERYRVLRRDSLGPWHLMGTRPTFRVADFDGRIVDYSGLAFSGTPCTFFWHTFMPPFMKDVVRKTVDHAVQLADQRRIERQAVLRDTRRVLHSFVRWVYHAMHRVEATQARLEYHKTGLTMKLTPTEDMESQMRRFVDELVASWPATASPQGEPPEVRDAAGLVVNPQDPAAYRSATKIMELHPTIAKSMKALHAILAKTPTIRRWKPSLNRLSVHLGDFQDYVDSQEVPFRDADGVLADPGEFEARKADVRATSAPRPNSRGKSRGNFPSTSRSPRDS